MDRRTFLKASTATAATPFAAAPAFAQGQAGAEARPYQDGKSPWPISLDTATIGFGDLEDDIDVAAEAGFDGIEPWMRQLEAYEENGGSLEDLGRKLGDRGLFVPSVIGLWNAIPTNADAFEDNMSETRRRMGLAAALGAQQVQTIPANDGEMDLQWAGQAYQRILDIGLNEFDINPALVFVEMFTIKTLAQATHAALAADHPRARIIPDTFHMHISGSGLRGLRHLNGDFLAILQFNDAPDSPSRDELSDPDRVMPGDGMLDLGPMLRDLRHIGFNRAISLEMYNPKYQQMDSLKAARLGLNKTVGVIEAALDSE